MKIATIVGARPQFIKLALLSRELRKEHREILIHTGQHYDDNLSGVFFKELRIPRPDYNLNVLSHKQGEQTALMLEGAERILLKEKPKLVIVYGDTNSTLAGALAAAKLSIPIAHIEAGLRSYRKDMPEEINRVLTDHLSTFLFCPTQNAVRNLKKERITNGVYNVGDIMYDALLFYFREAKRKSKILPELGLYKNAYFLVTVHRAENTNSAGRLKKIIDILVSLNKPVIFPVHPRTKKYLKKFNINIHGSKIRLIEPVNYFDMLMLQANAMVVLTDSGGVQKEAYFLNTPCITLREETEWSETVKGKGNNVAGIDKINVIRAIQKFSYIRPKNNPMLFGNGNAAKKIFKILRHHYKRSWIC
jgi:UDP-GlcNAc3NAcA epimerase